MENNSSIASLLLSSLGWLLLVVVTAGFFFFGQNYYYKLGYEEGQSDQLESDIRVVDKQLGNQNAGPLTQMSGVVQSVGGNRLTILATNQSPNPLRGIDFERERAILVGENTQIIKQVPKDPEAYAAEIEQARQNSISGEVIALQPFTEEVVGIDQVVQGQTIVVQGAGQQDLTELNEIPADLIYLILEQQ